MAERRAPTAIEETQACMAVMRALTRVNVDMIQQSRNSIRESLMALSAAEAPPLATAHAGSLARASTPGRGRGKPRRA